MMLRDILREIFRRLALPPVPAVVTIVILGALLVHYRPSPARHEGSALSSTLSQSAATTPTPLQQTGSLKLTQDGFFGLFDNGLFARPRREPTPQQRPIFSWPWDEAERQPAPVTSYRTMCVRLCDGYYYPVSSAAGPQSFERDSLRCQNSCSAPAKLFVYNNASGSPDDMADLRGARYAALPTAFRYRTDYTPSCKCKPDPWDEASLNRHRAYALAKSTVAQAKSSQARTKQVALAVPSVQPVQRPQASGPPLVPQRQGRLPQGAPGGGVTYAPTGLPSALGGPRPVAVARVNPPPRSRLSEPPPSPNPRRNPAGPDWARSVFRLDGQ